MRPSEKHRIHPCRIDQSFGPETHVLRSAGSYQNAHTVNNSPNFRNAAAKGPRGRHEFAITARGQKELNDIKAAASLEVSIAAVRAIAGVGDVNVGRHCARLAKAAVQNLYDPKVSL